MVFGLLKKFSSRYDGELKDGKRHGQGTYTWPEGKKYEGEWKDGEINGQGIYTYPDGKKYVGEFKDGIFNGQGTFTLSNGDKYEGEWKGGVMDGYGTYTYHDGDKYEGEYKDDKKHGHGKYTFPDGRKSLGEWKNGKFWNGKRFDSEGKVKNEQQEGKKLSLENILQKKKEEEEINNHIEKREIMNIDLEKSKKIIKEIKNCNDLSSFENILDDFCYAIKYYDDDKNQPSDELKNNEDYIVLKKYVLDAHLVGTTKKVDISDLIERIGDTETDLLTYLENYVYDDTKYENITDYISGDFDNSEKFRMELFKGYFHTNFEYYLDKLGSPSTGTSETAYEEIPSSEETVQEHEVQNIKEKQENEVDKNDTTNGISSTKEKLKELFDKGILTEEEYQNKKDKIAPN